MYKWRTSIIAIVIALVTAGANAAPFVCAQDLNGDGNVDRAGETATCTSTAGGELCPIGATACTTSEVCPISTTAPCVNGSCSASSVQNYDVSSIPFTIAGVTSYRPSTVTTSFSAITSVSLVTQYSTIACVEGTNWSWSGNTITVSGGCSAQFAVTGETTASCTTSPPSCPLGAYACLDTGGGNFQCSANSCVDQALQPAVTTGIDSSVYIDDGARDASGACMDQIMIFAGRNMECRTAGTQTAYQTCCKSFGTVVSDSTGSISEAVLYGQAVSSTWEVASAAWTTYQATGSAAAAASAAGNTAIVAFDPTTLAIAVAVVVVMDYLMNNCDQMDMETGILNNSGYCYETGSYCKEDWPLFGCVQRAKTYCCFNSKLARIIHEQGRPQLTSFNRLPANDCRGFTPEEFQYLDFSQIDLSEYYGDLRTTPQNLMEGNISNGVQDFYNGIR